MNGALTWQYLYVRIISVGVACFAAPAVAVSQDSLYFSLVIGPDATVSLRNETDQRLILSAYYIVAPASLVDVNAWESLAEQYSANPEAFQDIFGEQLESYPIRSSHSNSGDDRVLYFEDIGFWWPGGLSWRLGKPLGTDLAAIRRYVESGEVAWVGDVCECEPSFPIVFEIPEPATIMLLLCGLPVFLMLARRRRAAFRLESLGGVYECAAPPVHRCQLARL